MSKIAKESIKAIEGAILAAESGGNIRLGGGAAAGLKQAVELIKLYEMIPEQLSKEIKSWGDQNAPIVRPGEVPIGRDKK